MMPMFSLIEYRDNYLKISGILWQYYRNEPEVVLINSESFKFRMKISGKNSANCNTKKLK